MTPTREQSDRAMALVEAVGASLPLCDVNSHLAKGVMAMAIALALAEEREAGRTEGAVALRGPTYDHPDPPPRTLPPPR